jgi:hypothetical protein
VHTFYVGFAGNGDTRLDGLPPDAQATVGTPLALAIPARLRLLPAPASPPVLTLALDSAAFTLTAALVDPAALHYFRLADATVKPLPPAPPALACEPGDAYIAVTPAAARLAEAAPGGASTAIARFIHLRDYFNAEKLAAALLAHVIELGGEADPAGAGVLVVELR